MEYVQYNEDVYKDMCMQLMEDEQYIVLNTEHPELILPQTCAVVEFLWGGRALNRCPDEDLSHVSHSELRGKIEPFRPGRGADLRTDDALSASPDSEQIEHTVAKPQMRIFASVEQIQDGLGRGLTQFSCKADKNFYVIFDCKSEIQPFDNKLDSSTSCENDENMLSFSAQRAGNPVGQIFAQIFQKLGLRAPHEDDKNHDTQLRRVDFSLPNLSSNNPSSSTRFCEHSADKKQAGFTRLRLENDRIERVVKVC